jgi:DNA polymerase-3 subunit delta'
MAAPSILTLLPYREDDLEQLLMRRGHAFLLEGAAHQSQFSLAMALAQSWLCEQNALPSTQARSFCGKCDSCHLFSKSSHPDLRLLAPENVLLEMGWPLSEKSQDEIEKKKRKPSKEIRIEAMLSALDFSQRTASRAHGKVIVIFPAQAMNTTTANALLKTLEEPPASLRFVLATDAAHQLLPTIRSRCQSYRLPWSDAQEKYDDKRKRLPMLLRDGLVDAFAEYTPAQTVQLAMQVCHDSWLLKLGLPLRFFEIEDMPKPISEKALADWYTLLVTFAKNAEHPLKPDLFIENLVTQSSLQLRER